MKKFLKDYLGLLAAVGLASGSLFAFNISTSIDNALQVIKTIWVTSDGTTTNSPFMTMDGSGKYVSIGTTGSGSTLSVSGSIHGYLTNAYGVTSHIILDNGGALGLPFVGQYASGSSGMMIDGIDTANQAIGMINQNTTHGSAGIIQTTKSLVQLVYCRTLGCNNNADKNGIEADASGITVHGYASGKTEYNTLWENSTSTELMKIQNDGEFKQTRGEYTIENTNDIQPYAGGYKFAGARWRSGSFAPASGLSFDLMAGLLAAPSDPFPVFALKYMVGDQPYSQMLFEPDDVIFNMNSDTGPAGTTFSFGITKNGSQFIDDTDNLNNISTQRVNSSGNIVTAILNNGRVGINTNNPGNALQINPDNMNIAHNDLGLRFSIGSGHSGQVLGLNNNGDVVMVGDVGSFGGSGGGSNYWTKNGNNLYPSMISNNIGIGTPTPSETLDVSGTLLSTFTNQYGNFGLAVNNTVFGGLPGAGSYAISGGELLYAGVDHDGSKLSAELVYNSGNESQFISVSEDYPSMRWQSIYPSLHRNGINVTSTGVQSFIMDPLLIGPGAFTWSIDQGSELMRLTNTGRLGIGTSNPQKALDVSGAMVSSVITLTSGNALTGNAPYFFFVPDVQNANTVVMQPGSGEIYVIVGFANGTPGQEIRVIGAGIPVIGTHDDGKGNQIIDTSTDRLVTIQPHYQDTLSNIISILGAPLTTRQIFMQRFDTFGNDTSQANSGGTYIAGCTNETTTHGACFIGTQFIFDGTYRYPTARF